MKRLFLTVLCFSLLLTGCTRSTAVSASAEHTASAPSVTAVSYTGQPDPGLIAARMGDAALTCGELQVWYWAEIAQYRQSQVQPSPDFEKPLDAQFTENGETWQAFFLNSALDRWQRTQALIRHSREIPLPTEDAYKPDRKVLVKYMDGMPASRLLYGYDPYFHPNSQHAAWLEALPDTLDALAARLGYTDTAAMAEEAFGARESDLLSCAQDLNYAYMYYTTLTYGLENGEVLPGSGSGDPRVSIRQILLLKDTHKTLSECLGESRELLEQWSRSPKASADTFGQLASQHSQDAGSAASGGLYQDLHWEQLPDPLAEWCFDEVRQEGDTVIIPMEYGVHVLYFLRRDDTSQIQSRLDTAAQAQSQLLTQLQSEYPMEVNYDAVTLGNAPGSICLSDLLYPDIAHQRFPEVPLYLQQNYPGTMYGEYKLTTNGCGITSLAMIASYMADDELTPPEMCARYGHYSHKTGTSGSLFEDAPPQLGFYLIKKSYDWREAREYMQEGYPVVVCQYRGYWTSGGHYLVLETLTEDGMVQVRDSNMGNYAKLIRHKEDKFPWDTINGAGQGYWIFEKKATNTTACTRCGDPDSVEHPTVTDYLCPKCKTALVRRNTYLEFFGRD